MIEIIPAVLRRTYDEICDDSARIEGLVAVAQLDVCDGKFVPSKTWPYAISGAVELNEDFMALSRQEDGLPYWETLDWEIDLMIDAPEKNLEQWLPIGASRYIVHADAIANWERFLDLDIMNPDARKIGDDVVIGIGLAIDPETDLDEVMEYIPHFDFVQCMGIAKIGFQGQPFDESVLEKINRIRNTFPNMPISVDGGVSVETARELVNAGATRLIAGSAIMGSDDVEMAIAQLESAAGVYDEDTAEVAGEGEDEEGEEEFVLLDDEIAL